MARMYLYKECPFDLLVSPTLNKQNINVFQRGFSAGQLGMQLLHIKQEYFVPFFEIVIIIRQLVILKGIFKAFFFPMGKNKPEFQFIFPLGQQSCIILSSSLKPL